MPTFVIDAVDWSFVQDLSDVGAASRYSASYEMVTAAKKWDPAYFNGIKPYRGESNPDLVEIFVEADGHREMLIRGIVDRSGRVGRPQVRGSLAGRDLSARILDRYPSAPFTIQGATVAANGNIVYSATFITAIQQLLTNAGVEYFISDVLDYKLGSSIAVTTDRTYGEVLAELLTPLRWSEKHGVDTWFENDRLYVIGRDANFRGTRQVDAARITEDEFENTSLPAAGDVRIDGWRYERPVDDIPTTLVVGMAWTESYVNRPQIRTVTQVASGEQETYTVEEIEYYNARGQLYSSYKKKMYLSKVRTEIRTKNTVFDEDPTHVTYGSPLTETEQFTLTDIGGGNIIQDELISDIRRQWTYYSDNGDTRTMEEFEAKKVETGNPPLAMEKTIVKNEVYRRSAGHIMREFEYIEADDTGAVQRTVGVSDLGPFKVPSFGGGAPLAPAGKRMESTLLGAGSESSPARFSSDLLGDQASIDQIRTNLLDEYASIRQRVRFSMMPKLDIKVANRLTVVSPPSDWPASSGFFILSVSMNKSADKTSMDVEGVRWVAA